MFEQWLNDPSKVGATALMLVAIVAFYRVLILPRQIHVDAIAQQAKAHSDHVADMKALHDEAVLKYETDIARERGENERLRTLLARNVDVVDKSTETLRMALTAFEHAHAVRRDVFDPKKDGETH